MSRAALALLGILVSQGALAAPFADPTRPPMISDAPAGSATPEGPRLESVLIAPDRRIAVISGQQVVVGARFRGAEVVRISESEVVIRSGDGLQTLKLLPEARQPPAARKKGATP